MKLEKVTYKQIICAIMPILLVLPALIVNTHILLHHEEHNTAHNHDIVVFCDEEISFCECSDFITTFSTLNVAKTTAKTPYIIFKEVDINSFEKKYFNLFLRYKKGRSPPTTV